MLVNGFDQRQDIVRRGELRDAVPQVEDLRLTRRGRPEALEPRNAPLMATPVPEPADEPTAVDPVIEHDDASIRAALQRARGNRQAAASLLGISRTTLWRRLREMPNGEESPVAQ